MVLLIKIISFEINKINMFKKIKRCFNELFIYLKGVK